MPRASRYSVLQYGTVLYYRVWYCIVCYSMVPYYTSKLYSIGQANTSSTLLCQFIEPVTFVHCAFIFALRNITLGGYLDTRRNI